MPKSSGGGGEAETEIGSVFHSLNVSDVYDYKQ